MDLQVRPVLISEGAAHFEILCFLDDPSRKSSRHAIIADDFVIPLTVGASLNAEFELIYLIEGEILDLLGSSNIALIFKENLFSYSIEENDF